MNAFGSWAGGKCGGVAWVRRDSAIACGPLEGARVGGDPTGRV